MSENDLTAVYYTAGTIPERFAKHMLGQLKKAIGDIPLIIVKRNPEIPPSHLNIYRQALEGVRQARTTYVALCEDDVLYSPEHFKHRPSPGVFAYNLAAWNIFTWGLPIFTHKAGGRKNLYGLICERDLFIEAMEERFVKYPEEAPIQVWAEPGKYERQLGVTVRETEIFYTNPPNVAFSHETALSYKNLGKRKKLGEIRAYEIPYWGNATAVRSLYG